MPAFNSDKITFIHIPKTAGSSITRYLNHLKLQNGVDLNNHIFSSEIENPAPITFTVVRNPWDRVVSMYMFIKQYTSQLQKCEFSDFVLCEVKTIGFGRLLSTPQVRWIEPGVTHILRFENLEEDFKIIQDIFQCYKPLCKENKTEHDHYRTYYNDETRQAVAEIFKEDIEAFGYEF